MTPAPQSSRPHRQAGSLRAIAGFIVRSQHGHLRSISSNFMVILLQVDQD
jgi:hypothetical protein